MAYQSIQNHGIVGNLNTAALISNQGAIDWLCLPHFDSPSVFASVLDDDKGGHFTISPKADGITYKQFYWPDTNILVTRHLSPDGVGEITDFMPVREGAHSSERHRLIRRVSAVRGTMSFRVECRPAFNYARDQHTMKLFPEGAGFFSQTLCLELNAPIPFRDAGHCGVEADFVLQERESVTFQLQQISPEEKGGHSLSVIDAEELFEQTVRYWRRWISRSTYRGRWREMVERSALVLKLLTFEPTGAIVAAPTCSLPERIGGERNWDYRYTWIRDAAFTVYALMRIGFTEEAAQFMSWLEARCRELGPDGSLQIMYRLDGSHDCSEQILEHLEGYQRSRPVRIGNGAYRQHQMDVYGELMDSVYLYNKYGSPISYELWDNVCTLLKRVCNRWGEKDYGIWEVRGQPQDFVYSKVMSWVALDRGLRLADKRSFPADRDLWCKMRDAIYREIQTVGWNSKLHAFSQYYGSNSLDAANLIMPLVFFLSPTDPRMLETLDAISQPPDKGGLVSDSLVYRYNAQAHVDGLEGDEGSFNMCTFWLVEALTRAGRRDRQLLNRARLLFEKMLGYANHLGLYSEQTGPSGEALGNFPQALTHLAMISAAYNLDRALTGGGFDWPGLPRSRAE
jgi:GH15 family glucan-1,4-alpha-glucosidase